MSGIETNFSEAKIQQLAVAEIRNKFPETYGCLYHVPNGGLRDKRTASILKGQGVVPGIPDLHFIWEGKIYLIEVKDHDGPISSEQKLIHAQHKVHGLDTYVFRTSEQIIYFVTYIIQGKSLHGFNRFISPYSVAENVELYREELSALKIKRLQQRKAA
ncbi:VRR-NUC domain-containing protein [Mucilaginibacter lappiensis]|uniref:VRR-NUC domain-containing protein n=1 Tax=Mucilaginibacter lappiensis TaxID=354630 RepID=A0ABR6PIZ0_9SPHI|nr:VRR-NUC domain-containing protein [Mucilaginibacter lappiensis]MBB6109745.1 hypothetical protein [Mucilaginibacter lappiensis]SIR13988.1 VRR-NUC domain-containing protein [Mucilaginibacter lappiensis]